MKPYLLLLPGMLCDQAFWRAQIEALSDVCIARVPSYGTADTIEDMADRVLEGAPERFAVAGHSMGGRVALELCRRAPHRVTRLGLFCTDYRDHQDDAARDEEAASRRWLLTKALDHGTRSLGRAWFTRQIAAQHAHDLELVSALEDMAARHTIEQLAAEIHAGLTRPSHTDLLSVIDCPTLVCAAEEDPLRPVEGHAEMAAKIPRARLVIIAESGHMVAMEQPKALSAAMRDWLRVVDEEGQDRIAAR